MPKNSRQKRRKRAASPQFIRRLSSWLVLSAGLFVGAETAYSVLNLQWDPDTNAGNNIPGSDAGTGGAGTWGNTLSQFWLPFTTPDQAWSNTTNANDTVTFAGTAGTVTLANPISAGALVFNTTGYTMTGSTLTLSGSGSNPGTVDFGSNLAAATISSAIAGGNGLTFNGNGNGVLTLNGTAANTYTGGTIINSGQISITSGSAGGVTLGAAGSNVTLGGTAIIRFDNGTATASKTFNQGILAFNGGDGTITNIRTASVNEVISFSSLSARAEGATGSFVINVNGSNILGTNIETTISGQTAGPLGPGNFYSVSSAGPFSYAVYDTTLNSVRGITYGAGSDAAFSNTQAGGAAGLTVTGAGKYEQTTATLTGQGTAAVTTLNISSASPANLTLNAGATFTTQGLLRSGGSTSVIGALGGGSAGITSGGGELVIRADVAADNITLNTPIVSSTGALTKSGLGILTLAPNSYASAVAAGNTVITVAAAAATSLTVGQTVSGAGIPGGTTITAIGATTVTLSAAPTLSNAAAILQFGANNAYTGTTYVNAGTLNADGAGSLGASGAIKLSGGVTDGSGTSSATILNLLADGDGLGTQQSISFGQNTAVVGNATISVGKLSAANALNKTIQLGTLTLGEDTLNVTTANGYGLQFAGATTLTNATGATTFNVGTATPSNVVQSLTLSGVVSSTNTPNLIKQGAGVLVWPTAGIPLAARTPSSIFRAASLPPVPIRPWAIA